MAGVVRIGTRGSPLARWRAEWVAGQLRRHHPGRDVALVEIKTRGDRDHNSPLAAIAGIGVFTKEFRRELLEGTIDLAVHSLLYASLPSRSACPAILTRWPWVNAGARAWMIGDASAGIIIRDPPSL
jgi:hydroxymethylbilane synthase